MSSPRPGTRRSVPRSLVAAGAVVIVVVAAGIAGLAYLLGQSVPAAVSLDAGTVPTTSASSSPPAASASPVASMTSSAAPPTTAPASSAPASTSAAASSLDGAWTVDTTIGSFSAFTDSFVGYRVAEQLANVGATTAVGRTPNVKGTLTMAGTSITAVKITVDLSTLVSDRPMRDGQLRGQALQTDQFPTATFDLTAPIQLGHVPADGETLKVTATGNLTLHGVTKAVSIPLQAKLSGGVVTVVGSIGIAFADYAMTPPQSMMVMSVADTGTMELQLHFTHG